MSSQNSHNGLPNFPKLKEPERYSQWSYFVQTWLQGGGDWDYVTGEEVEPHPPTVDPATGVLVYPSLADAEKKKQKAWNQGQDKDSSPT